MKNILLFSAILFSTTTVWAATLECDFTTYKHVAGLGEVDEKKVQLDSIKFINGESVTLSNLFGTNSPPSKTDDFGYHIYLKGIELNVCIRNLKNPINEVCSRSILTYKNQGERHQYVEYSIPVKGIRSNKDIKRIRYACKMDYSL